MGETMKARILVSRKAVDQNRSTGSKEPVFTIVYADGNEQKSSDIIILGPCAVKYDPTADEGKRVWIETFDRIVLKDDGSVTGQSS